MQLCNERYVFFTYKQYRCLLPIYIYTTINKSTYGKLYNNLMFSPAPLSMLKDFKSISSHYACIHYNCITCLSIFQQFSHLSLPYYTRLYDIINKLETQPIYFLRLLSIIHNIIVKYYELCVSFNVLCISLVQNLKNRHPLTLQETFLIKKKQSF